jgi:hypothetical protein
MKKTIATIATVLLAATLAPAAVFGAQFSDLPSTHWAYNAVVSMSEVGIVSGYPDGTFKPSGTVTYGEFIKMAYIAQGGDELDAEGGDWAVPYYEAAADAGLFARHEIPNAKLPDPIPREYMALVLSNALGDVEIPDYDAVIEKLADVERNAPHVYDIVKAAALGLITGYPDGTFRPEGTLTRAEAATVISRLMNTEERQEPDLRPAEEKTPLERLEGAGTSNFPLQEVLNASASQKPISDILDTLSFEWDGGYGKETVTMTSMSDDPILYYEIFEDYPHQMTTTVDRLGEENLAVGEQDVRGYLIRDRKPIAKLDAATMNGVGITYVTWGEGKGAKTFPDFDYIAVKPIEGNTVLLIPNNLK